MKVFTVYSHSHEVMLKKFMQASLPAGFESMPLRVSQRGDGKFGTAQFSRTMMDKWAMLRYYAAHETEPFVYCDADVVWMDVTPIEILKLLGRNEMVFQRNAAFSREVCSGFFVVKPCESVIDFIDDLRPRLTVDFNERVKMANLLDRSFVRWNYLPESFWHPAMQTRTPWDKSNVSAIPRDAEIVHAAWTEGDDNKLSLLRSAMRLRHAMGISK